MSIVNDIKQNAVNALGRKTNRKLVVIASDDWGAMRMPSREVYDFLLGKGLSIETSYNRYDSLATEQDIVDLFDVLSSFKDQHENSPSITANCVVANPDFDRIKEASFQQYYFEPFAKTLQKHPGCARSFSLWQEGIARGIFYPQYHAREHLNVPEWMNALQNSDRDARLGFECCFWGHSIRCKNSRRNHYLAAYDYNSKEEFKYIKRSAVEGLETFQNIFNYQSKSFVAPNFVWAPELEKTLLNCGVSLIQGQRNQLIPVTEDSGFQTKFHYTGQKNRQGQVYLVRNVFFEPSSDPKKDWVSSCLKDLEQAFFWRTPAVISAHRVNFIGAIVPENREKNLALLKILLASILKHWPNVEFVTSDQLANGFGW